VLVLTRLENESILIGENIVVTLIEIRGNKVRLGIQAPKDVRILRTELMQLDPKPEDTAE